MKKRPNGPLVHFRLPLISSLAFVGATLLGSQSAQAATYYWDTNDTAAGFGTASGTWGTDAFWNTDGTGVAASANATITTADNVNFGNGATALAAGTITGPATAQGFLSMTFASGSGAIVLSGGTLDLANGGSTITVNNATDTVSTVLQGTGALNKAGTGILVLSGTNTYGGGTNINAGTLQFNSAGSIAGSGASVTVASGATAAAGYAMDQAFLNRIVTTSTGSAALGANTSTNLDMSAFGTLSLGAVGAFDYTGTTLSANGSTYRLGGGGGTLGITNTNVLTGATNLVVTGNTVQLKAAQDYSGTTTVNSGTLDLRGSGAAGSILNTSGITVNQGATFLLTNDVTNGVNLNRVADNTAITLNSGVFNFGASNAGSTTFSETVGQLNVSLGGHNRIVTPGTVVAGSTSTLTFASLNRTAGTALSFGTTANLGTTLNKILFTAAPTVDAGGLIGGWATAGSQDFAAYGANGVVVATSTATNAAETGWATGQNVKITTAQTLTSNRAINALSVVSPATATALNLGGFTLRLESGGILGSQSAASNPSITNGNLTAGVGVDTNAELFLLDSQGSTGRFITISANIVDNGAGVVSLVTNAGVNGNTGGLLIISGANTYAGTTTLAGGQTTLGSSTAINNSKTLTIATGATLNMGGFTATVDALLGGGALDARSTSGSATSNNTISIGNSNGSGTFTGSFNVAGSSTRDMDIIKNGTGTQVLAGSDFRDVTAAAGGSTTTINNGTLQFARQASLYNNNTSDWNASNIIVNSGGTLALRVGGNGEFTSANVDTIKGLGSATGGFKSGSSLGLDTTNAAGGVFSYASVIGDTNGGANSVGLTKLGTGTLTLGGTNTYTGATSVSGGTLATSGTGSFGASNITLANTSGVTLTLGNATSIGDSNTLTFGSLAAINLSFTGSDTLLSITNSGGLTLSGTGLTYTAAELNTYFSGVTPGSVTSFTGGGTFTIAAVPEPRDWGIVFGAACVFAVFMRARNRKNA